jgi:hypothetical protein
MSTPIVELKDCKLESDLPHLCRLDMNMLQSKYNIKTNTFPRTTEIERLVMPQNVMWQHDPGNNLPEAHAHQCTNTCDITQQILQHFSEAGVGDTSAADSSAQAPGTSPLAGYRRHTAPVAAGRMAAELEVQPEQGTLSTAMDSQAWERCVGGTSEAKRDVKLLPRAPALQASAPHGLVWNPHKQDPSVGNAGRPPR